jgi:hypothetical protein
MIKRKLEENFNEIATVNIVTPCQATTSKPATRHRLLLGSGTTRNSVFCAVRSGTIKQKHRNSVFWTFCCETPGRKHREVYGPAFGLDPSWDRQETVRELHYESRTSKRFRSRRQQTQVLQAVSSAETLRC